jgi:phosphoenolpyruvate phosphomutase
VEAFCQKIRAGLNSRKTKDFMIIARCESLILNKGMDDALNRCFAYVQAGVDGVMIHSCKKDPAEILEFCRLFRARDQATPLIVVPTTYNTITEKELQKAGVNIVIHANHLLRSAFPAMQRVAEAILENGRSLEAEDDCMSIKEILTLIPAQDP